MSLRFYNNSDANASNLLENLKRRVSFVPHGIITCSVFIAFVNEAHREVVVNLLSASNRVSATKGKLSECEGASMLRN